MKVLIQQGKAEMSLEVEKAILERIDFVMARINHRIRTLQIRLDDLNGPKGGIDKRCVMAAVLAHRGCLVVEVADENVLDAVSRAARRLVRRVVDEFERSRDLRRREPSEIQTPFENERF